ncbi:MAG: DUF302 domain-containing protein [Chloroflexota bacterium]
MNEQLGFEVHLDMRYEDALDQVTAALKQEGFGVLTRIDVKATLKEKLGTDFRPYAILGACNPPLAHQSLSADASVGLMLPCNVTVEADAAGIGTIVRIANPEAMMQVGTLGENPTLVEVSKQASAKLARVAATLKNP